MFLAGIDGGGTSTKLELRDGENRLLRREKFGPFNINSIGESAFRQLLEEVFAACGDMADCACLCVGAAGISNPRVKAVMQEELDKAGFRGKLLMVGDQEIALRGAMDTPGIALIAGTGSIAFGRNAAGETARSGGYGHLIDDGGSGYALGRDALSAVVRALDGRGKETALTKAVFDLLGISSLPEIVTFVYGKDTDKSKIARLSLSVVECAGAGDQAAIEILRRGAAELAELVAAVQRKLDLSGCPVALLGGVLNFPNCYRETVSLALEDLGSPMEPQHDALWGAAQMAWEAL